MCSSFVEFGCDLKRCFAATKTSSLAKQSMRCYWIASLLPMDEDLGGFFGPPMLTFVVDHFFLLQTQLSKLMFFRLRHIHAPQRKPIQRSTGFGWAWFSTGFFMCAFFPQNWLNHWLFHQKNHWGFPVLAHVDSCRKMDLKEVSEVEVPRVERGGFLVMVSAG